MQLLTINMIIPTTLSIMIIVGIFTRMFISQITRISITIKNYKKNFLGHSKKNNDRYQFQKYEIFNIKIYSYYYP